MLRLSKCKEQKHRKDMKLPQKAFLLCCEVFVNNSLKFSVVLSVPQVYFLFFF